MDSIAISKLTISIQEAEQRSFMLTLQPLQRIKFTVKAGLNSNITSKIDVNATNLSDALADINSDDYISILKYDIRCKIYITNNIRILLNAVVNGIEKDTNTYYSGLLIRF